VLQGVEEGVDAAVVAGGHGGDIDIDGVDAVVRVLLRRRMHQGRRLQVDLAGQGDQRPVVRVVPADVQDRWDTHGQGASVHETVPGTRYGRTVVQAGE
jgi:hypothetical protein